MKKFNNPIHLPSNNVIPTKPKQILNTKKPFKTTYPKRYKNQYQRRVKKVIPVYNRTIVNDKLLFHEKNQLIPNAMTASTTDIVSVKSLRNNSHFHTPQCCLSIDDKNENERRKYACSFKS